jgi:hypothetical protein
MTGLRLELVVGILGLFLSAIGYLLDSHTCEFVGVVATAVTVGMSLAQRDTARGKLEQASKAP